MALQQQHQHGHHHSGPLPEYLRSEGTIQALHGGYRPPPSRRMSRPATLWSAAKTSAAAPRANMRLSPSKQAVYPSVIASSFTRIFYRNGINVGLPLLEIGDDVEKIHAGDTLRIDISTGKMEDLTGDMLRRRRFRASSRISPKQADSSITSKRKRNKKGCRFKVSLGDVLFLDWG